MSLLVCAPSYAQWGGALGFSSLNLYRGMSLSGGHGAWLADVHDRLTPTLSAGLSATGIQSDDQPAAQVLAYGNYEVPLAPRVQGGIGYTHYDTINYSAGYGLRYDELMLSAQLDERWSLSATATPNLDIGSSRRKAYGVDVVGKQPLSGGLSAVAGLGYYRTVIAGTGYRYANAGLDFAIGRTQWSLFYSTTDDHAREWFGKLAYRGLVGSVLLRF